MPSVPLTTRSSVCVASTTLLRNVFFCLFWRVVAVPYDPVKKAVPRTPPDLRQKTQGVEWVQFRLNDQESDIEIVQPVARLRQVGFDKAAFCSLNVNWMNQSFATPVTANAASRDYGDANPTFTYGVTTGSLVNGDALTGALATTAIATSNVQGYGITQGTLAASANYAVTYAGATLTVNPRAVTVTASPLPTNRARGRLL